jgi:hypothetical protein
MTIRGPEASIAARKLPAPLSLRFVTLMTAPRLPPAVSEPHPCAPGKAGKAFATIGTAERMKRAMNNTWIITLILLKPIVFPCLVVYEFFPSNHN